ncbi:DUF4345 domain-containing protein [Vibrio rotiferianus]|uniref:DUF4345 domain-containing protein n=1 Tax=Vibrio rotiferianus TaxID=190895 RepID=UPI00406A66B1
MNKTLLIAGIVVAYVGMGMLASPFEFFDFNSAVTFTYSVDKASEFRGVGAFILLCGLFITSGAVMNKQLNNIYILSLAIYSSFSLGRITSFIVDGIPNQTISLILGVEIILFVACLISFYKHRKNNKPI